MAESLLSFSEVLLFGRLLNDLKVAKSKIAAPDKTVRLVAAKKVKVNKNISIVDGTIDGEEVAAGNLVLVTGNRPKKNGIYEVTVVDENYKLENQERIEEDALVKVTHGDQYEDSFWQQTLPTPAGFEKQEFIFRKELSEKIGANKQLKDQYGKDSRLARIYGFSFEGTYYELPEPTIFLVHGKGESPTDGNRPGGLASRAPSDPSLSGVASADYQISDDIRVWDYDKADYTIRMDVMTGQFEQVLLDIYFGFDSPAVSGAKVSGAKVSGAKVSGAKVSGAKVSGAKVSGAKVRGGD
ncbi:MULTISPECIES: hypothetical protein [unclassified Ruegeria]|uniref:hypothetical protein n=1 Tax=unclassified Ruegeria TaxID=2625375 RepID=UPI0014893888|nr:MULTISPECIES: hypothetical protein [unclassified Ruegeria]